MFGKKADDKRFIVIHKQSGGLTGIHISILQDKQTGANYIFTTSGYSGGLTALLDKDGKPVITPLEDIKP
jgi:hypothetical protein